jgi:hypothetical protein
VHAFARSLAFRVDFKGALKVGQASAWLSPQGSQQQPGFLTLRRQSGGSLRPAPGFKLVSALQCATSIV